MKRDIIQMHNRVISAAHWILLLWKECIDESNGDCWYKQQARQAYQDSIIQMKRGGLFDNYDVVRCKVEINGTWFPVEKEKQ